MERGASREKLLDAAFAEVYRYGYHGTGTASILKAAGVPKGSMYHFFPSKKALILAVSRERIVPKMEAFFDFARAPGEDVFECLERIFGRMGEHEALIANGCPLHRLLVEMAPLDADFEAVLSEAFSRFVQRLAALLQSAVARGELKPLDAHAVARFIITSTWGEISLPPSLSSKASFSHHIECLMALLKHYGP